MKNSGYYCPTCHTIGIDSIRRHRNGTGCCLNCVDFVLAMDDNHSFRSFSEVLQQNRSAFPPYQIEAIQNLSLSGEYVGTAAINALNKLSEWFDVKLAKEIAEYCYYDVLIRALNILDDFYRDALIDERDAALDPTLTKSQLASKTRARLTTVGWNGQAMERIIELALRDRVNNHKTCSNQNMVGLMYIAAELVEIQSTIENFLCLGDVNCKIIVSPTCWNISKEIRLEEKSEKIIRGVSEDQSRRSKDAFNSEKYDKSPNNWFQALETLRAGRDNEIPTFLGRDQDELIRNIEPEYKNTFGHAFTERMLALLYLAQSSGISDSLPFEDVATKFLIKKLKIDTNTADSILKMICLDGDNLKAEGALPVSFRRLHRILRRPIPRFQVGNRSVLFLSSSILVRGALELLSEYMGNTHPELEKSPIKKILLRLNQDSAAYFAKESIGKKLESLGFIVKCHVKKIGNQNLEVKEIGEIDILAFKKSSNELVIGECKFHVLSALTVRQIRREIDAYSDEDDGYIQKLKGKTSWVQHNLKQVTEFVGMELTAVPIECVPVFFTNWYSSANTLSPSITIVQESEIDEWARKY